MGLICTLLGLYLFVVFLRVLASWFPVTPGTGMAQVVSALYNLTEPVLAPLRQAIPPVRMGGAGLDLSPLVLLLGIQVIRSFIC